MTDFTRIIITDDLHDAYQELLRSSKGNNENELQRKLALFLDRAYVNKKEVDGYYEKERGKWEKGSDREKLISGLKFVGAPGKLDISYQNEWESLLRLLEETKVIDEETVDKAIRKLGEVFSLWKEF